MKITVTGKDIDVGDALREYVENKLNDDLPKFFGDTREAKVTFTKQKYFFRADCSAHAGHELYVHSHGEADDVYAAFDQAADRMAKQLRRNKRKLSNHHKQRLESAREDWSAAAYVLQGTDEETDETEGTGEDGDNPVIIAETKIAVPHMTVSEAVMRVDLGEIAVTFRNSGNGRINVVYRRNDGNIGWVDPETPETETA